MYKFLESILHMTAWPMTPPAPYSAFHILLTIFGTGLAVLLARILSKKGPREYASLSHNRTQTKTAPESYLRRVLFFCGVILALMELYKQAFLYFIEFDGRYDWWYFPFQLCSIPMYLCLAVPFLRSDGRFAASRLFFRISVSSAASWRLPFRRDSCTRTGP